MDATRLIRKHGGQRSAVNVFRSLPRHAYSQFDNLTDRHYTSSYAIRNRSGRTDNVFLFGNGRSVLAGLSYRF
jgi:hypothetical protein